MTSCRSAGAVSSECRSTLPALKTVGSLTQVVGWAGMTTGEGRKPPSVPIAIQVRSFGARDRGGEDGGVYQGCRHFVRVQEHLGAGHARALRRRVRIIGITENAVGVNRLVERQVEEAVVGRVQDAEAVGLGVNRQGRVGCAVDRRGYR